MDFSTVWTPMRRTVFHLCDIISTVGPLGSALSNHWTARHCHYRLTVGTILCYRRALSLIRQGSRLARHVTTSFALEESQILSTTLSWPSNYLLKSLCRQWRDCRTCQI